MRTYQVFNDLFTTVIVKGRPFWNHVVILETADRRIARKYARRWGVVFRRSDIDWGGKKAVKRLQER